jgi:arylsulfatase A-like enzyme
VVFASDHGEMLGDYGRWGKGTWHEASLRVPLIVRTPNAPSGPRVRTTDALVQVQDIGATALAVAGAPPIDGDAVSILPIVSGDSERVRDSLHCALKNWKADVNRDNKLISVDGQQWTVGLDDRPV